MRQKEMTRLVSIPPLGSVASEAGSGQGGGADYSRRVKGLVAFACVLMICFAVPLYDLVSMALKSDLYSHILLIPFISFYLIRCEKTKLSGAGSSAWGVAAISLLVGISLLAGYWLAVRVGWGPKPADYLALMTLSFLAFLVGGGFMFLGTRPLRQLAFPVAFLLFMIPFPTVLRDGMEHFFQYGSADAAQGLFWLTGMPAIREGTVFQLPGFALEVAPQCSGIHSNVVLFITSLLAGHLLLKSPWRRALFTLAVIPIALIRNGIRIVTIGQLCVCVSPEMIDSYIHTHGGPIFFALSLIPFFFLLILLRRGERNSL